MLRTVILLLQITLIHTTLFALITPGKQYLTSEEREKYTGVLRDVMLNEQGLIKIKAADYLLALDYPQGIKEAVLKELSSGVNDTIYKIGLWKILVKTNYQDNERNIWIEKIRSLLKDEYSYYLPFVISALNEIGFEFTVGEQEYYKDYLNKKGEMEEPDSSVQKWLKPLTDSKIKDKDYISCLIPYLQDPDPEIRIEAANTILRQERQLVQKIHWHAWYIIGAYFALMLGIGYIYMQRNKSSEDYLLGGRKMKSWTVGLSLFATLLSSISYISTPGELIKNGPLILGFLLATPVVYFIVGGLFIPFIMRLKVTSAYEILEVRFNGSVRTLSSIIFLMLRLLWMSVIIYTSTDKVIIPILGLDREMTPVIGGIIAFVTILYTSMGGIRAVVLTDAIQSFILYGGSVLIILVITIRMGGIGKWWPDHWISHWAPPQWGFQTSGDRALGWFILSPFVWWICTTGSDQMSIQRFLSTRDAAAARKVLLTSLIANSIVLCFLSLMGLALLAYFTYNPHLLKDGQTIYTHADQLLPQFIVTSLPVWISGIVIAGLMAAAMSSLSSGLNSSSAVITEDFINRFRKVKFNENIKLRVVKIVSAAVGMIVVIMSLNASIVRGNLLEVSNRVANLFTAPLFVMFFMAMFIPWATVFGAWIATISSAATAILIAFWYNIFGTPGPSFLFIMPISLLTGVITGIFVSLLPIGPQPKKMITRIMSN